MYKGSMKILKMAIIIIIETSVMSFVIYKGFINLPSYSILSATDRGNMIIPIFCVRKPELG